MNIFFKKVVNATSRNLYIPPKEVALSIFFLIFLLSSNLLHAQDQFLWLGMDNDVWENKNNWAYYPYGGSTRIYPAPFYPGQGIVANPNGTKDDIAVFTNISSNPCRLTTPGGSGGALRIGAIHVRGYAGTITQNNGNRFNIAESVDLGGAGLWNGTATINSGHPNLSIVNGAVAYQAHFDFATGGRFIGGGNIVGGISPSYALLIAVPLRITSGSRFAPPEDEMRIRHNAVIHNGSLFEHLLHKGTVVLSNRTSGLGTRQYSFPNVRFWNLKVTPNGAAPRSKEFTDGTCTVDNNFMTTGALGELYAPSHTIIMNATPGVEVHVKKDIILGNVTPDATLTAANDYGNLVIVINGDGNQNIDHSHADIDFQGNLPHLKIDKPTGQVTLKGPVTVNGNINFVSGHVQPETPSTQNSLTTDVFVLNSNATVSGMSDASFCRGAIRMRTGKTIELPIGKGDTYRPAIVRAVSGVSVENSIQNMYRAEYFEALPAESPSIIDTDVLNQVSTCEVWAIQKEAGDAPDPWTFQLELSYNPDSDPNCTEFIYPTTNPCLAVSRWNDAVEWVSHGNGGAFVASNGDETVRTSSFVGAADFKRSDLINRPDLFTFGKLEAAVCSPEPCEVHVCVDYSQTGDSVKFEPRIVYGTGSTFVNITWDFGDGTTSTELMPTHAFTTGGVHFVDVTVDAISGSDTCRTTYTFGIFYNECSLPVMETLLPPSPPEKSEEIKPINASKQPSILSVTPNPTSSGIIQFLLEGPQKEKVDYFITNNSGQTIWTGQLVPYEYTTIKTTQFPTGTYVITVSIEGEIISQKFVVSK